MHVTNEKVIQQKVSLCMYFKSTIKSNLLVLHTTVCILYYILLSISFTLYAYCLQYSLSLLVLPNVSISYVHMEVGLL